MRAVKNRVGEVAAKKFHSAGLRFRQIRAGQDRFRHVRVSQVGLPKIRARQVGTGQLGLAQVRAFEVRFAQNRSAQIDALQIRARKIGAGQVRPRTAFFPTKEKCMRLKNVCQPLPVVLNIFRFSQSHSPLSTPLLNAPFYPLCTTLTSASRPLVPFPRPPPMPFSKIPGPAPWIVVVFSIARSPGR